MREEIVSGYQVLSDGRTCWVNAPTGESVARFSAVGIDVHRSLVEQRAHGQCLDCVPGPFGPDGWARFKASVRRHFGLELPDKHEPKRRINWGPK